MSLRTREEIQRVAEAYGNMLFKLCLVQLGNGQDAEDAVQEALLRYIGKAPAFNDGEHEKAWLISVAVNLCRDMRRFDGRHRHINIDELRGYAETEERLGVLETLMSLPLKYKAALHLFYIEGYGVTDIAEITGVSVSAVKKRLQRGREMLRLAVDDCGGECSL